MARVLIRFRDAETWRLYDVGDEWEGTPERLDVLARGGFVEGRPTTRPDAEDAAGATPADMTVAQLREVAASRGIEVPKRATKAKLLKLLEV